MWNLSGGGGATDLQYLGSWAAGTYNDGQIVVDNGIAYMATKTTTARPTAWPGSPNNLIPAVTSAQMSAITPYDGQLIRLIVDATLGIEWTLAYRAASASTYKWEFTGGAPMNGLVFNNEVVSATGWVDTATVGPQFTLPRAGDYWMIGTALSYCGASASIVQIGIAIGAATPFSLVGASYPTGAGFNQSMSVQGMWNVASAGANLRLRVNVNNTSSGWQHRSLTVIPVRVS